MIELKAGNIQMFTLDGLEHMCDLNNVNGVIETEIEPCSMSQEVIKFNREATFTAEITECSPMLNCVDNPYKPTYIEYRIPVMVQARWHKKPRVNKKWLKRYGMKEDSVLVRCQVESFSSNTNYDPYYDNSYCFPEHAEYAITLNSDLEYKFRPDQLRKNLKMEMCYG